MTEPAQRQVKKQGGFKMPKAVGLGAASLIALSATCAVAVRAEDQPMKLLPNPGAIKWEAAPESLPKGTQIAVLAGDPGKPGPFALRVKFPPNTVVPPHTHATAETLTQVSGTFFHGMGDKLDKSRGEEVGPGGFVYLPGNMPHSVWTTTAEAITQVNGTGPFGLNYVNPADDPSKAK
jgi:quercetin dioxygenase-like cupin family protein